MAFCIEKFSTWFCLIFSTEEDSFRLDFESFSYLPIDRERFDYILSMIKLTYSKEFRPALGETFDFEKYCCFKDYMEVIISKCLEFSKPPSHLRFLIMCTFIYRIISERTTRKKICFAFAKMVSQCLIEVYNRHYKNLFKSKDNIKSFETLCKQIDPIFKKGMQIYGSKELEPLNQQDIVNLMNSLNNIQKSRRLNSCVQEIIMVTIFAIFPKDSFIDAEESTSTSEYEPHIKEESSISECECDETSSKDKSNIFEPKSECESRKEESGVNESESDETSNDEFMMESQSDETLSNEESIVNESESDETSNDEFMMESQSDETLSNEESDINESQSEKTLSKEESSINESKSDETFLKEESFKKECESSETSSNEKSSISESESNKTSSKESRMNKSTESLRKYKEDSYDPSRICQYCNLKCFEFVSSFLAKEIEKNETNL